MPHSCSGSTSLVRSPKRHAPPACRKTYMHARSTRSLDVFGQSRVNDGRFQQPIQAGRFEKTNAKVKAFLDWPYLLMDATYVKVRQSGRKARPALVPARRDVGDLRRPHASRLRCRGTHLCRAAFLAAVFVEEDAEAVGKRSRAAADQLRPKAQPLPKLGALMDEAKTDVHAFMTLPKDHASTAAHRLGRHIPERGGHHAVLWCSNRTTNESCSAAATRAWKQSRP